MGRTVKTSDIGSRSPGAGPLGEDAADALVRETGRGPDAPQAATLRGGVPDRRVKVRLRLLRGARTGSMRADSMPSRAVRSNPSTCASITRR
jgi:hypothetical protein